MKDLDTNLHIRQNIYIHIHYRKKIGRIHTHTNAHIYIINITVFRVDDRFTIFLDFQIL